MNDLAIRLDKVNKTFKYFTLNEVDLHLPTGQIMGFVGANGAGKSTILNIAMGLLESDVGFVEIDNLRYEQNKTDI